MEAGMVLTIEPGIYFNWPVRCVELQLVQYDCSCKTPAFSSFFWHCVFRV